MLVAARIEKVRVAEGAAFPAAEQVVGQPAALDGPVLLAVSDLVLAAHADFRHLGPYSASGVMSTRPGIVRARARFWNDSTSTCRIGMSAGSTPQASAAS